MTFDAESIDLLEVSQWLKRRPELGPVLTGFLEGKTRLRDSVIHKLRCSELEAEQLIDTLVALGYVRFLGDDGAPAPPGSVPGYWAIEPHS